MNLIMMLRMFVSVTLCMFIVSNTLLMSKATTTARCGGLGLLKPFIIWRHVCMFFYFTAATTTIKAQNTLKADKKEAVKKRYTL